MEKNHIDKKNYAIPIDLLAMAERKLVAAIDFGTTYSGYAFSRKVDFLDNPLKITENDWSKSGRFVSHKAPTCILFDDQQKFHSFGYDAERKYMELATEGIHLKWHYFRWFKMCLYGNEAIGREYMLFDDRKYNSMLALDVFTASIKFLKEHLIQKLPTYVPEINTADIHWVLTVPAIWTDAAKQFMREAATSAGIESNKLSLALEPEAASLFCRYLPVEKVEGVNGSEIRSLSIGDRYLILDAGGGTVDLTVHEVQIDKERNVSSIKELHCANGGHCGGRKINEKFEELLNDVLGYDVMEVFTHSHSDDYDDLMERFELLKRTITPDSSDVSFHVYESLNSLYKQFKGLDLHNINSISEEFKGKVTFAKGKMKITANVIKSLFDETCDQICTLMKEQLQEIVKKEVKKVLMVGGFSKSKILQEKVRKTFPDMRVIIPEDADLAVLRGAVIFGHNPQMITSRVCRYTYGIEALKHFEPGLDPTSKRVYLLETFLCKNYFSKHAEIGQEFKPGEMVGSQKYFPSNEQNGLLNVAVYTSPKRNPLYTDEEGCKKIGEMTVKLFKGSSENRRPVVVKFVFGKTELGVVAIDENDENGQNETTASFNFL